MKNLRHHFMLMTLFTGHFLSAQYTLTLNLQNMDDYLGHRFQVRVTEQPSDHEVGRKTIESLGSPSTSLVLYTFLDGRNYNVDFYADVNDNDQYDAPPVDHAWRRVIVNAGSNIQIDFSPDEDYFDVGISDPFPYSQYNATWGGKWMNQTFSSTDSIMASFILRCDSVFGMFMTKGVFGNPAPVTFSYAGATTPTGLDTINYPIPSPWTGSVTVIGGDVMGSIALAGTGLNFTGTLGAKQMLCVYTVLSGGNPFANGYFYVKELDINSSAPPIEIAGMVEDVSCAGAADGSITANPSGGTGQYSYLWTTTDTAQMIVAQSPGDFGVTVTDSDGCSDETSFSISEPSPLDVSMVTTNPNCSGSCDGLVNLTVNGGTPGYTYLWSTGLTTEDYTDACAGDGGVTVTDANGCTMVLTFSLMDPPPFAINNVSIVHPTDGQSNGSITVDLSGGTPPYTYSLDGITFISSNVFSNLAPGAYIVYVQDGSGCLGQSGEILLENMTAVVELKTTFMLYPNPVRRTLHLEADVPLAIELLDGQGRLLDKQSAEQNHFISLVDYSTGIYFLKISDGENYTYRKIVKAGN